MDVFLEYIIAKQSTPKDILLKILIVIGTAIVAMAVMLFQGYLGPFALLVAAGVCYGGYVLFTSLNVEYEYSVTNGELDIDKIISQRKRKRMLTIHSKQFEIVAPVRDTKYQRDFENVNIKRTIEAMGSINKPNVYFAVFNLEGQKTRLIFEPTQRMLEEFKKYVPRNVFDM